jgi:uncharacterized membrane protein YsdA (DUF1294 family)
MSVQAYAFLAVDDAAASAAMQRLADPALLPQPLVVGETGIAGWAGFTSM